ncbi:unnamed protein product [Rotaria socialis]|uniref:Uncharacterized protein n=8 Tax=Rotaria TaxID=231623 RepID=A0A816R7Q8_9BILA|nr:unnamed protein product [Rotaria magnacalcarata]CAF3087073.1 unnamed protein product [Rotaria socialis]CAF1680511.1 unnamed protein product [Rotaria magnacalcarata]CAF2069235.1 unnamed protein product [Rotaria magnacalcarata]CAF2091014.1 unnamed protein product [Rotaria magnacalcarata]
MKTEITENKMVTFEYHNVERRILLHRDVPLREIHDILKSDFGLPASASLLLFNIVGNYSVCGSTAGILWALNDAKVPKYRIVVGGETSKDGEKVEQDGWYKWFMKNYILKVFGSEYPDEQKKID